MRLRIAALAFAIAALPGSLAGCGGCPTALREGALVRDGLTLVVVDEIGNATPIRWPFGYAVTLEADRLVVTDLFGVIKAREGDQVRLGGGMVPPDDEAFGVCGDIAVDPA